MRIEDDSVWLSQAQMVDLFQTSKQNISLHIRNLFKEGELVPESVVKEYLTTAADGKSYRVLYYNLDLIISVGYRVRSHVGTRFRIWATQRLRDYVIRVEGRASGQMSKGEHRRRPLTTPGLKLPSTERPVETLTT